MFKPLKILNIELIAFRLPVVLRTSPNLHLVLSHVRHLDNSLCGS